MEIRFLFFFFFCVNSVNCNRAVHTMADTIVELEKRL